MGVEYKEHNGVVEVPLWDFLRLAAVLKVWVHDYSSYPEEHTQESVSSTAEEEMKLVLDRVEAWAAKHAAKDPGMLKLWQSRWEVSDGRTDEPKKGDLREE